MIDLQIVGASSGYLVNHKSSLIEQSQIFRVNEDKFAPLPQEKAEIYVEKTVAPAAAKIGDTVKFTIVVTNAGKGHAENLIVTDPINHLLTVNSVDSTKGTVEINPDQIRIEIGTIDPDSDVTITILTTVNQQAVLNIQVFNTAYAQYPEEGKTISRTSNTVSILISGTETLPATGGMEINNGGTPLWNKIYLYLASMMGTLGIGIFAISIWLRNTRQKGISWLNRLGILMVIGCLLVIIAACNSENKPTPIEEIESAEIVEKLANTPVAFKDQSQSIENILPSETKSPFPESQPTKPESGTVNLEEQEPDMSQVARLVIPRLGIDHSVVYSPFDGMSWDITNLGKDIAWMESTSIPGLGSNTALSAHVTAEDGSEGPFKYLGELEIGDLVEVYTEEKVYSYKVAGQEVVADTDFSVIEPTLNPRLTLITCAGWHVGLATYLDRLVVVSDLVDVEPISDTVSSN